MKLGTHTIQTYTAQGAEVIKLGAAGDNFGHVQDILTQRVFGTYGYQTLAKNRNIRVKSEIIEIETGYLQYGTGTAGPFRTEAVRIKHEYADNYKAWFEGRWRVIHHTPKTANGYHIVFRGERIPLAGWSM